MAAKILVQAELTDAQLVTLAREQVAQADVFLLPRLVEAFEGSTSAPVGTALVSALQTSTERLENLSEEDLRALFMKYPAPVQTAAEPVMAALRQRHQERVTRLQAVAATLGKGDVAVGRRLFFGKALCSSCHAVAAEGGTFGPDLTNVGEIRARHDILEAILYPSASFAREYDTYRVKTKTNSYTGIIAEQLSEAIVLSVGPGGKIRIPRGDIVSIETLNVSMMPPGLDQQLTPAEMADLMAYLEALPDRLDRLIPIRERAQP
jgi:putative heme-binding domain-containing protein